jgi:hypothetical protein
MLRRPFEQVGGRDVASFAGQCEVSCTLLQVELEAGEACVEPAAPPRSDRRDHCRREQRMDEPDPVVDHLDDPGRDYTVQMLQLGLSLEFPECWV